jgi:hypothetical protein
LQEGLHLQIGHIDGERQLLHVCLGKGGKDRYVPLSASALDAGFGTCTRASTRLMAGNIYPIASFSEFLACAGRLFGCTIYSYPPIG